MKTSYQRPPHAVAKPPANVAHRGPPIRITSSAAPERVREGVADTDIKQQDLPAVQLAAAITEVTSAIHVLQGVGAAERADCYINDDVVQCVFRGTAAPADDAGGVSSPTRGGPGPGDSPAAPAGDLSAAVGDLCGREVIAFMRAEHVDPDILSETYILYPSAPATAFADEVVPIPAAQADQAAGLASLEEVYRLTGVRLHRAQENYARRYPGVAQRELVLASMVKRPDGTVGQRRTRG